MFSSDFLFVLQWWALFFLAGSIFLPLTNLIFSNFIDRGYVFSKILGIIIVSYTVFLLGIIKVLPFTTLTILLVAGFFAGINILILKRYLKSTIKQPFDSAQGGLNNGIITIFFFEEVLFFIALLFWSYIRAHQPDIQGLEKFMDFGFVNSILRSEYFPPKDMWFTPFSINYYYFGHLITAVLTKLSEIPSSITYNFMLSTIFAFTFTGAFSIGGNLIYLLKSQITNHKSQTNPNHQNPKRFRFLSFNHWNLFGAWNLEFGILFGGFITAFLVSFAGNLHSIYAFFKPYVNEDPVPFWQLIFSPQTFPNAYWYPNATRFIHDTIHEFPLYSFVVSDLHGHVLDIPIVLLIIAVLLSLVQNSKFKVQNYNSKFKIFNFKLPASPKLPPRLGEAGQRGEQLFTFNFSLLTLLAFLLAIMYMTNAWDGIIYFLLVIVIIAYIFSRSKSVNNYQPEYKIVNSKNKKYIENFKNILNLKCKFTVYNLPFTIIFLGTGFILFSLPFSINFKPFVSGIGILCAPEFLTDIGKIGPFLFEANHCQKSPLWQLLTLYGFFYFFALSFIFFLYRIVILRSSDEGSRLDSSPAKRGQNDIANSDIFVLILIFFSTLLILIPEFIYVKDIYPAHYRANTMFKFVYQAFIMLSIASGYIVIRLISSFKFQVSNLISICIGSIGLLLVMIYPYLATNSYYGNLKTYYGLDGTRYLKNLYPQDYEAVLWLNKNIKNQLVILEAQGDSYTDYGRISTNTGLPTVLGWAVHEWLWRGTYDIPSPRIAEVQNLYETEDVKLTKKLINKYKIEFVFIGELERQKYSSLNEEKFKTLGKIIFEKNQTRIYQLN